MYPISQYHNISVVFIFFIYYLLGCVQFERQVFHYCKTFTLFQKQLNYFVKMSREKKKMRSLYRSSPLFLSNTVTICELDSIQETRPVVDICVYAARNSNVCIKLFVDKRWDKLDCISMLLSCVLSGILVQVSTVSCMGRVTICS